MTAANAEWCPVEAALELLSRKWMLSTIRPLLDGELRFVELRTATRCPSPSTFTRRLRMLEAEGIVSRRVGSDAGVHYALTDKGRGLGRVLGELGAWAERWLVVPSGVEVSRVMEPA